MTPIEQEQERRAAANAGAPADEAAPRTECHIYPDGSQRFGVPPFPERSPIQEAAELNRLHSIAHGAPAANTVAPIPPGMPTSGAPAAVALGMTTESEFKAKVEQQLASDIASGKSPDTPNPTTSSDKPELAGIGRVPSEADTVLPTDPTAEDLGKIAASLNPGSELPRAPTEAEIDAAVTQVARETSGPVVTDDAGEHVAAEEQKARETQAKETAKAKSATTAAAKK